jgi:hypothetical protein
LESSTTAEYKEQQQQLHKAVNKQDNNCIKQHTNKTIFTIKTIALLSTRTANQSGKPTARRAAQK